MSEVMLDGAAAPRRECLINQQDLLLTLEGFVNHLDSCNRFRRALITARAREEQLA
jgi:hypothetical protein